MAGSFDAIESMAVLVPDRVGENVAVIAQELPGFTDEQLFVCLKSPLPLPLMVIALIVSTLPPVLATVIVLDFDLLRRT